MGALVNHEMWHASGKSGLLVMDALTRLQEVPMVYAWLVLVLAGAVLVGSRAVANGYLVVMRSRRHDTVLLELGSDERYHVVRVRSLPVVLGRYAALRAAYSLLLLRRRAAGFTHHRKPVPLAAKA